MKKIPTAEELYYQFKGSNVNISKDQFIEAVKFSNELHVKAALEAAVKKAKIIDDKSFWSGQAWDDGPLPQIVDKKSILKAYPKTNIK